MSARLTLDESPLRGVVTNRQVGPREGYGMSIMVRPGDDTSFAESQGWGKVRVATEPAPLDRIVFYIDGKVDGEYAYIVRDTRGEYLVSPDGKLPWSTPIALPQTARSRAEWVSKRMRECEHGRVHFGDTLRDIKEYLANDGGV